MEITRQITSKALFALSLRVRKSNPQFAVSMLRKSNDLRRV